MRHHIFSEDRKTIRISADDLLKVLCIDSTKFVIRDSHITGGGFERNDGGQVLELSLVERAPHEARK
jgi:hypothetical protein